MNNYVEHYDNHYRREGERGAGQLVWQPQYGIWQQAGYTNQSICDYGCGVGVMLEAGLTDYIGVDISQEAISLAQSRYPGAKFAVFEMGDLACLGQKVCVAQSVFSHTPKAYVSKCLADIKRNFTDFAIIDILLGDDKPDDYHVRHYREDEWLDYLWKAGLQAARVGEHNFVGFNHIYYKVTNE